MKDFKFDIFQWGRYKCTVRLKFPKNWIFSKEDIIEGIESKYPSLKGQEYTISPTA
jgi:hypothetical protein